MRPNKTKSRHPERCCKGGGRRGGGGGGGAGAGGGNQSEYSRQMLAGARSAGFSAQEQRRLAATLKAFDGGRRDQRVASTLRDMESRLNQSGVQITGATNPQPAARTTTQTAPAPARNRSAQTSDYSKRMLDLAQRNGMSQQDIRRLRANLRAFDTGRRDQRVASFLRDAENQLGFED